MLRAIAAAGLLVLLAPRSRGTPVEDQDLRSAIRQLDTGDWKVRMRTVHELEYLQEDGIPALTVAAVDGDWQVRMAAVHALAPLGSKSVPILSAILKNEPCPVVRLIALHDLGSRAKEGDEEKEISWMFSATAAQVNACRDQPEPGRASWAAALHLPGPPPAPAAARPAARAAAPRRPAEESHERVVTADVPKPKPAARPEPAAEPPPPPPTKDERYAELDALLAEPAAETLGDAAQIPRRPAAEAPRVAALAAGARAKPDGSVAPVRDRPAAETMPPPVVNAEAPEKPAEAPAIFEAAGGKAPHDAVPELILALKKGGAVSRARAADELGSLRGAAAPAVPALLASLKDKNPRVRASASLALGNIGADDKAVVPLLVKALKDKNLDVRYAAALALSRAGTPEARAAFKRRLGEDGRREIDQ